LKRLRFPKSKRLLSNRQFKAVLGRNRRAADNLLTLFVAPNDSGSPRLGVSVGRKICGKATVRNRLKRLVLSNRIKQTENPRKAWAALTFDQVQRSFLRLVEKVFGADRRDGPQSPERNQRSKIEDQN